MPPRVSYLLGRLDRVLRRRLVEVLEPHGLTLPEYTALSVLRERQGLSNAQLARRSLITPQAMNEVLARLEARGLAHRPADAARGRIRPAELTPAAVALLAAADADVDVLERRMLSGLPAAERERLQAVLSEVLLALADRA